VSVLLTHFLLLLLLLVYYNNSYYYSFSGLLSVSVRPYNPVHSVFVLDLHVIPILSFFV